MFRQSNSRLAKRSNRRSNQQSNNRSNRASNQRRSTSLTMERLQPREMLTATMVLLLAGLLPVAIGARRRRDV